MAKLLLLFTVVPIVELALLLEVGRREHRRDTTSAGKSNDILCQMPLTPQSNTVIYGDDLMHIVVAGSR